MNSKELKSRKQALLNYIATGTGTRPKKLYSTEEQLLKEIGDRINSLSTGSVTVEDVLASSSQTNALSANQGKVLKERIDGITNSTTTKPGLVKKMATQADSTAEDTPSLKNDFNSLLTKLKGAGLME